MKIKGLIVICFLAGISATGFAQIKDEQKTILEGEWVLEQESVRANKGCNHEKGIHAHEVSLETVDVVIYTEIKVKQDTLFFISANDTLQTTYVYTKKTGINFGTPNFPFTNGCNVYSDRMYLYQRVIDSLDETEPIYVSFVYEYKSN